MRRRRRSPCGCDLRDTAGSDPRRTGRRDTGGATIIERRSYIRIQLAGHHELTRFVPPPSPTSRTSSSIARQMFREMGIPAEFDDMAAATELWLRHAIPSKTYLGWIAVVEQRRGRGRRRPDRHSVAARPDDDGSAMRVRLQRLHAAGASQAGPGAPVDGRDARLLPRRRHRARRAQRQHVRQAALRRDGLRRRRRTDDAVAP